MELHANPTYAFISTTSTTYHPENPLENAIIDNPGLVRRRRRKTSARELEILEMAFRENEKPSKEVRDHIARQTGMDGKAVQVSPSPVSPSSHILIFNGIY
jgi:Homeodomain